MIAHDPNLVLRLAEGEADIRACQRLRYRVFVEELGGDGPMVDHAARLEADAHDPDYDHLMLIDRRRQEPDHVIGVYRLRPGAGEAGPGYYCAGEYDLGKLTGSGRRLLELGRSCLDPEFRGGSAMYLMWQGLAGYIQERGIEILFGVASFQGTNVEEMAPALSLLHHRHLAPAELRVRALDASYQKMDLISEADINRREAMAQVPALMKAYLRLGGFVGEGAFIDRPFNTTDVCLILDISRMDPKSRALYMAAS
ncbi:MAG: GNAT family N-acetyltransferase [Rhodobacteraceae bacterium]|nr:GNAT family N-acetyltransferase [Paracoccaceae bacterium]